MSFHNRGCEDFKINDGPKRSILWRKVPCINSLMIVFNQAQSFPPSSFILAFTLLYCQTMFHQILHSFWLWCVPPLSERTPHTIFSLSLLFLTVCLPTVAAYIRLYHPSLSFKWRVLYMLTLVPIVFRNVFLHYTHWNAANEPSSIWGNGDAYMGGCSLSILIFTLDFLFLASGLCSSWPMWDLGCALITQSEGVTLKPSLSCFLVGLIYFGMVFWVASRWNYLVHRKNFPFRLRMF